MALNKKTVPITFTLGADATHDSRYLVPGQLTSLVNGVFSGSDIISKRPGFAAMGSSPSGTHVDLLSRGSEFLCVSDYTLHSWSAAAASWIEKGKVFYYNALVSPIIRNNDSQKDFDFARLGNYSLWAWGYPGADTRLRYTVLDETTGATHVQNQTMSATGRYPRVLAHAGKLVTVYVDGTSIKMRVLTAPATLGSEITIGTSVHGTDKIFDAYANAGGIYVAFKNATPAITINKVDITGSLLDTETVSVVPTTPAMHFTEMANGSFFLAYRVSGTGLRVTTLNSSLTTLGTVTVEADTTVAYQITSALSEAGTNKQYIIWDVAAATGANRYGNQVRWAEVTDTGGTPTATAGAVLIRGANIACQGFRRGSATSYVGVTTLNYGNTNQSTFFMVGVSTAVRQKVVAKAVQWKSYGPLLVRCPSVYVNGETQLTIPVAEKGRLAYDNAKDVTPTGISRVDLYGAASSWNSHAEFNGCVYFASALPQIYDGKQVLEEGFPCYPDDVTATSGAAGNLSVGDYQYVQVYEHIDGTGRRWQSVPSTPVKVTIVGSAKQVTVEGPNLRMGARALDTPMAVVFYRTEVNGTVFYRVNTLANQIANDPTTDKVSFTDNNADSTIRTNEILYSQAALQNMPAPSCWGFVVHQERLWALRAEDSHSFYFSKQVLPGEAVGFNDVLRWRVLEDYGTMNGAGVLDDKICFFVTNAIYYVSGEGPNAAGLLSGYSEPQLITSDVGLIDGAHSSIVKSAEGLWFQSRRGLRLLSRSMEIARTQDDKFAGSEMDPNVTGTIRSAFLHPLKPQIWFFVNASSTVLVWDFLWSQWSKFSNYSCAAAFMFGGKAYHSNGSTIFEEGGVTDNGTAIALTAETGWLSFVHLQGLQRVYALSILGDFKAASTLQLQLAYDHDPDYGTVKSKDTSTIASASNPMIQVVHKLAKQKCRALKIKISETGGSGAGFTLVHLALEIGLKRGIFPVGSGNLL